MWHKFDIFIFLQGAVDDRSASGGLEPVLGSQGAPPTRTAGQVAVEGGHNNRPRNVVHVSVIALDRCYSCIIYNDVDIVHYERSIIV